MSKLGMVQILLEQQVGEFTRRMGIIPAFDNRSWGGYTHGAELMFGVERRKWFAEVYFSTPFFPSNLRSQDHFVLYDGTGTLEIVSPIPIENWAECEQSEGPSAWITNSGLQAKELFNKACQDPEEIWKTLEKKLLAQFTEATQNWVI